ncbi:MAG TPA: response regulator [Deltaproteobacteria bacterium]|nr:response regulator [Deltaproteobacteria bacterium]
MPNRHILIVEDETKLAVLLKEYLERAELRVSCLERGDQVVAFVKHHHPDLVLLDLMLPGMDGMEVCRELRKFTGVPIIMITARVDEIDRLLGLELGADDYICKPYSPREVVARVKAVLRRIHAQPSEKRLSSGGIDLDEETHQVWVESHEIKVTPSEFRLLKALMAYPGRVFSRADLVNLVQGYEFEGYERTIDSHIKNLRKKIAAAGMKREAIMAVYGEGYKFNPAA